MIGCVLSLVLAAVPQDPASGASAIVKLNVGTEISGRVVHETEDYIELEISTGNVVGFAKSRTLSIVRTAAAPRPVDDQAEDDGSWLESRDEWSLVHDGSGRAVGWVHATVGPGDDGEVRIGEEWRFFDESGSTELTVLEVVGASGEPLSSFYHERFRGKTDPRVLGERVVHAVVDGQKLVMTRRSTRGDHRQTYPFPSGTRFPLEALAELRHRSRSLQAVVTRLVFDPRTEQFVHRSYDVGRRRRVEIDGKRMTVRVVESIGVAGRNAEWIDGASRTVRREISGSALVAVPTTEQDARRAAQRGEVRFAPSMRIEEGDRFAMWLPNPMWRFVDVDVAGQLTAHAAVEDAAASLVHFDQLDPGLHIESAADAVLRWLRLLYPELRVRERAPASVRHEDGVRVVASFADAAKDPIVQKRMDVYVFRAEGLLFALCCTAPYATFDLLDDDFQRILSDLELRREGFDPKLQGPLARERTNGR
jgi:hypothetical protein